MEDLFRFDTYCEIESVPRAAKKVGERVPCVRDRVFCGTTRCPTPTQTCRPTLSKVSQEIEGKNDIIGGLCGRTGVGTCNTCNVTRDTRVTLEVTRVQIESSVTQEIKYEGLDRLSSLSSTRAHILAW